jgi:hypothetical protein
VFLKTSERLLPSPDSGSSERQLGKDNESSWSPSVLTTLNDAAAERNNELETAELIED